MAGPFPADYTVVGTDRDALDLTRPDQVAQGLADSGFSLVVNAAGYTAVDRAESEPEAAFTVNRDGIAHLAAACAERRVPLVHLSTDYVFDGSSPTPYREDDPVAPLSVYGASKAAGEQVLRQTLAAHVILRVSWLYGAEGRNFIRSIAGAALAGRPLRVVNDQTGAPTHVDSVAAAIAAIAAQVAAGTMAWGTYHFAARGEASWYQVASLMLDLMEVWGYSRVPITAVSSAEYSLPARRPANSRLDCGRFDRLIGSARPEWQQPLTSTVRRVLERMGDGA